MIAIAKMRDADEQADDADRAAEADAVLDARRPDARSCRGSARAPRSRPAGPRRRRRGRGSCARAARAASRHSRRRARADASDHEPEPGPREHPAEDRCASADRCRIGRRRSGSRAMRMPSSSERRSPTPAATAEQRCCTAVAGQPGGGVVPRAGGLRLQVGHSVHGGIGRLVGHRVLVLRPRKAIRPRSALDRYFVARGHCKPCRLAAASLTASIRPGWT